jgi:predicted Rossmann-fold nucleotide-binding protein
MAMGALLASLGFDVMTGGYKGVMEAVSRGAHDHGAKVVGVTMTRWENRVNRYVMEEVRTADFCERFRCLVDRADAYVGMGGGIGTLAEVTFTWQELHLGMVPQRPLVLVGPRWRALFKCFADQLIATPGIFDPLTLVDTPEEAANFLRDSFALARGIEQATPSTRAT